MTAQFELPPPPRDNGKDSFQWKNWFNIVFEKLRGPLWDDYTTAISAGKLPAANYPTYDYTAGPSSNLGMYQFGINDYIDLEPIHIKHDIKPDSKIYPHVHWTLDGTNVNDVHWELSYSIAKGHNQEAFSATSTVTVIGTPTGTAWTHMVSEVGDANAIDAPEVDSLVLLRLKRITNGATENTDAIYGLTVDLHYQKDRLGTPQRAPNFYLRGRQ